MKGLHDMKTVSIKECTDIPIRDAFVLDLMETEVNHCIGCWTCWWRTPGQCIHSDLENFYRAYVNADRAVFYARLQDGFVSSRMKSLFDRMIPLFLPYTTYRDGGTYHTPRYPRYPDVEFYFDHEFVDDESYRIFEDYIHKVFDQFHAKKISIRPISESREGSR